MDLKAKKIGQQITKTIENLTNNCISSFSELQSSRLTNLIPRDYFYTILI